MPLPKSLTQPFRRGQLLVGGAWRAYFTPFNSSLAIANTSTSQGPNILDLQVQGPFNENSLPAGWFDLGWINKFKLTPASKIGSVRSGYRGAIRAQYRGQVGESFEFTFRESTRMAWKIATGCEIFNLLSNPTAQPSTVGPLSSSGSTAVSIGASGYVASFTGGVVTAQPVLFVAAGQGNQFSGQYIVCDDDYNPALYGQVGYAGIPVFQNAITDVDFLRKTSDFVARVVQVVPTLVSGQDGLVLNTPGFVGGGNSSTVTTGLGPTSPDSASKIQIIKGWSAREGGTFITEWSALIIMTTIDGSQIAVYYPHVSPNQFKDIAGWTLENAGTTDLTGYELDGVFEALAYDDPLDGETVVRYSAYYPHTGLAPQI